MIKNIFFILKSTNNYFKSVSPINVSPIWVFMTKYGYNWKEESPIKWQGFTSEKHGITLEYARQDSNLRPYAPEAYALIQLSYGRILFLSEFFSSFDGIFYQHCDCHWTNTTRNRCDRRNFINNRIPVSITNNNIPFFIIWINLINSNIN